MSLLGVGLKELASLGAAAYTAWTGQSAAGATNSAAAGQQFQGPVVSPEMALTPVSASERRDAYNRHLIAYRKPWLSGATATEGTARRMHPSLLDRAAGTYVRPTSVMASLRMADAALSVANPVAVKAPTRFSAPEMTDLFEVKPRFSPLGVVRFETVMGGPAPKVSAVREAILAGDVETLVAASNVVFGKEQAARAELAEVPGLVVSNALLEAGELAELQAAVQDPAGTLVNLLNYAPIISGIGNAAQTRLSETLTAAGLDRQGVYSQADLVASMKDLVEAARSAGVEPLLLAELESRLARLLNLNSSMPTGNLGAALARNYFQFYGDTVARITANSTPAQRAHVEQQLALVNSLGMLALQTYLPRTAPRDVAFLILANFVGLNGQVDREPATADARFQGSKGTGSVAAVGPAPESGDDGQKGGSQSWN